MVKLLVEALLQLAAATQDADVSAGCYRVLAGLPEPHHGDVKEILTTIFHNLSATVIVNPLVGRRKGKGTARAADACRRQAINFAAEMARTNPRAREAVAALARHVCLK